MFISGVHSTNCDRQSRCLEGGAVFHQSINSGVFFLHLPVGADQQGFPLYWLGRSSLECVIHRGLDLSHEEVCYLIEVEIQTGGPGSPSRGGSITLSRTLADLVLCSQMYILSL